MIPHPTTVHVVTEQRRKELLTNVKRERQAATTDWAILPWRQLAVCAFTLVALALAFRV
jgi:hypothetical protein